MKRFLKIRYFLFLGLGLWLWSLWSRGPLVEEMAKPPEAGGKLAPGPPLPPRPRRRARLIFKKMKHLKSSKHPKLGAEPSLELQSDSLTAASDLSPEASSLFENIAFSSTDEVKRTLGAPEETFEHEDHLSWYYKEAVLSRQGKSACPEVQFIDGKARTLIMWSPDKMQELIDTARRLKARGDAAPKGPETFTFMDSFKYLGVGTPVETVLEDLGEPDSKEALDAKKEEWDYDTLIVENGASQRLAVIVEGGKVVEVQGR